MSKALIAQLLAQREGRCDFREKSDSAPAQGVVLRRPPETEWGRFMRKGVAIEEMRDIVIDYVVGWYGMTEADLLGESIGSTDEVEFSRDLWAVVVSDRSAWVGIAFDRLLNQVSEYIKQRAAAAKN